MLWTMYLRASLFLFCCLIPASGHGAETDWVELAPDVKMRLVSSNTITDENTLWMAFEIDMPQATKTYWRVPGESGIPLVLEDKGSRDLSGIKVAWPFPNRENDSGYLDHSYYGHAVIPVEATLEGDAPSVALEVKLGICSDVCIPASARFDLAIDLDQPDTGNGFRIRQALATVPQPIEAQEVFGAAIFDLDTETVQLELLDTQLETGSIIAEREGALMVFDEPRLTGDMLVFEVLGRIPDGAFDSGVMRFTYETPDGPFETTRELETQ